MGRFKADAIIVRDMESLTIIFKDSESIWIFPKNASTNIIFNRWWTPKGSYGAGWQDFRRKMFRNAKLDLSECYRIAYRHNIQSMGTTRAPNLEGKTIRLIYKRKTRRKNDRHRTTKGRQRIPSDDSRAIPG